MTRTADAQLDQAFAALSHPVRRAILARLAAGEEASVSDLAEPFDISLMAVSRHVRVLEKARLVQREKEGRVQRCRFDPRGVRQATDWLDRHRRFWEGQLDALQAFVEGAEAGQTSSPPESSSPPDPESPDGDPS